jgi:hypothetical protein
MEWGMMDDPYFIRTKIEVAPIKDSYLLNIMVAVPCLSCGKVLEYYEFTTCRECKKRDTMEQTFFYIEFKQTLREMNE